MIITPQLAGNVARSCHPIGCQQALQAQIDYVRAQGAITTPKRVLILGASSGFGLAARVALAFGGGADTYGVSFERGPSEKGVGSAGWYNNCYFRQAAEAAGLQAANTIGDAFSPKVQEKVIADLKADFGQIDMVIYSLATGRRDIPATGESFRSVLKTTGAPVEGNTINLEAQALEWTSIPTATSEEITHTTKVMGGEGWQEWIEALLAADLLAPGAQTLAFSYLGPELSAPVYRFGTIGVAKEHLHATANHLNEQLQQTVGGIAYPVVAKALVTKASVFIPVMSVYLALLMKQMKANGTHEGCIEQCYRLFATKGAGQQPVLDEDRQLRLDDYELAPSLQAEIAKIYPTINGDNFKALTDFDGYLHDFMALNGFDLAGVDYSAEVDMTEMAALKP
ncbi:enoyl-ACP reductase FabV [Corallincola spongiicola]|uniref:Enoyl-[acyl-carrier-protein] reductase [NADH] n=1 Tax=Corallincola spongiicola TaxID=2520508 RepID=A0ABY1WPF5_9GAMM|nr:enoyl-ACP reductase FabV [Corallincola spongiicola]TAA45877.1 trans-2-enoyl-CoA reductase family protein [Corallincola spongiicola]